MDTGVGVWTKCVYCIVNCSFSPITQARIFQSAPQHTKCIHTKEEGERESQVLNLETEVALATVTSASTINKRNFGRVRLGSYWERKANLCHLTVFKTSVYVEPKPSTSARIRLTFCFAIITNVYKKGIIMWVSRKKGNWLPCNLQTHQVAHSSKDICCLGCNFQLWWLLLGPHVITLSVWQSQRPLSAVGTVVPR